MKGKEGDENMKRKITKPISYKKGVVAIQSQHYK